jgi:PilZ domain
MQKYELAPVTLIANPLFHADVEERRRYDRVGLSLSGRYMHRGGPESTCTTINISPEGLAVIAPGSSVDVGEPIIAYISQLGRVEGTVVRQFERGFVIKVAGAAQGRETLVRKITAAIRRRKDAPQADRQSLEAELAGRPTAPMTPDELDNLTAVIRALLERSAG